MVYKKNFAFALVGAVMTILISHFVFSKTFQIHEMLITFFLWLPYKINGNHYSLFGGFSETSIYSLFGIFLHAGNNTVQFYGINLYQHAGNVAIQGLGISLYQHAGDVAIQGLGISLYQHADNVAFQGLGISLYQEALEIKSIASLYIIRKIIA